MNTNKLKKFAQEARRKLMEQVGARLEMVFRTDSAEIREKAGQIKKLQEAINDIGKVQLIDKVAYTWFNRLMALRFMDANDYQPIGLRVITPKAGYTQPELLDEAKQGHIPDNLPVKKQHIYDLLDGKIPSANPQNEAYKELLIGACNHLNKVFPFLFERIDDYTELLLPDDLISEFSIVQDVRNGMTADDCREVEIIGWLYQFYISEKKDELINAKKKYKADEIAPVTQLFTPKWIVKYMVDNTLGQLWKELHPKTKLTQSLQFYIEPQKSQSIPERTPMPIEEIKFFDPCVGSAHILCYAYDLFYQMYQEEGYNPVEIPELIITKNLFGIDIDERAVQLAGFALVMKGREYHRRFLRKTVQPNITAYQNIDSHPTFQNAKVLGSLIKVDKNELKEIIIDETSLFAAHQKQLLKQAFLLADKYDIVATNPPYLNSSHMEGTLKQYIEKEYKDTRADLFACFVIQAKELTKKNGFIGFISPCVWMFISSYEKLREKIIDESTISSLVQLEYNAFEPACVPIATFVLRNSLVEEYKGSYIKLSEFKGHQNQAPKTLEAIQNPHCGWFYTANQKDFKKIPGSPIGYWLSESIYNSFNFESIGNIAAVRKGNSTSNNNRFLRLWYEIANKNHSIRFENINDSLSNNKYWIPYNKGGGVRRWYGFQENLIYWKDNAKDIRHIKTSVITNEQFYMKPGLTWSTITSSSFSLRWFQSGFIFDNGGCCIFNLSTIDSKYVLGTMNGKVFQYILSGINPTLNFQSGEVSKFPIKFGESIDIIVNIVDSCINISKLDWDGHEGSWDFLQNELLRIKGQDLEESYDLYQQYWRNKFFQLHRNEEELNRQFIEIYGLQDELTPDVPLEDITILKEETSIGNGQLVFHADEVFAQFVSYAVGCMFGRYSLYQEGLILANQGETLEDYLRKIQNSNPKFQTTEDLSFVPDEDNIIPVLDDEWFADDVVGRFCDFLKASFGRENFEKNLAFVEDCLGKDIRRYFIKDFYADHIRRFKKRPIYWMFSSSKGSFNVLIYMHRYMPDTLSKILNGYLKEYREKLQTHIEHLDHLIVSGSSTEQARASKQKDKFKLVLIELQEYERDILYPLATQRIAIELDDGVLVNYNKFGRAIKEVDGLNDKATKKKVKGFDWINTEEIR